MARSPSQRPLKQATQRESPPGAKPPSGRSTAPPGRSATEAPPRAPAAASAYRTQAAAACSPEERLPESVNLDDLVSTGVIGLIAAIDRFDASHNVKLKTYAEYKIRGAILDSLRGLDWAPRQQRKRSKQIEAAIVAVEQRVQRSPTEDEIAAQLGLSLEEYYGWLVEIRGLNLGSLENASGDEDNRDLLKFVSDDEESWPSRLLERGELKKLLAEAISKMPDMEKTVLSLYYHEELTLREISKICACTNRGFRN